MRHILLRIRFGYVLPCLALVLFGNVAWGDGVYIPPEAVENLPAMPHQRAVVIWRDGVEQLLVESDFDGKGESMAWILPVPDVPSDIEIGAPGVFDVLQEALVPQTVSVGWSIRVVALFLLLWCACQLAMGSYAPGRCLKYTLASSVVFFILFMSRPLTYHTLGDGVDMGPKASAAMEVLDVSQVGSYEVCTLRAKQAGALTEWLQGNGFRALPEDGDAILKAYIEEGWCFIAAKLEQGNDGYTRPHPLSITFASEKPVYPMRLTRLANTDLFLDLYVIADRRATAPGMDTVYCERFECEGAPGAKVARASQFPDTSFGLPWLASRMQANDVLTHLRARVPADAMHQDISIKFRRFARTRPQLQLPRDRMLSRISYALSAFGLVFGIGLTLHYKRIASSKKSHLRIISLLVAVVMALAASLIPVFTTTLGQHETYDPYDWRKVMPENAYNSLKWELRRLEEMGDPDSGMGISMGYGSSYSCHLDVSRRMDADTLKALAAIEALEAMDAAAIEAFMLECLMYPKGDDARAGDFLGEGLGRFEIIEDERGILFRTYARGERYVYSPGTLGIPLEYLILNPDGKAVLRSVDGMDDPPQLSISPRSQVSFGNVPPGERAGLFIQISNYTYPIVTGRITVEEPFYVSEEDAEYTLKARECKQVAIEFRPTSVGKYGGIIYFEGNDSKKLEVNGISFVGQPAVDNVHLDKELAEKAEHYPAVALRNDNPFPVTLEGWGISNDPDAPFKHTFPRNTAIPPNGCMIVHMQDGLVPAHGYSLGFELKKSKEGYLGLCNPDGDVISRENYWVRDDDNSRGYDMGDMMGMMEEVGNLPRE